MKKTIKDKKKLKKIANKSKFRGFYHEHMKSGDWHRDNGFNFGNSSDWVSGYSIGFKFTHGVNKTEHLYNKLKENLPLSKNERIEFDECIGATDMNKQMSAVWYDFSEVLTKLPIINAWVIDVYNISQNDKESIAYKYGGNIDYNELCSMYNDQRDKLEFVKINFLTFKLVEHVEIMYNYDTLIENISDFGTELDDIGALASNEKFISLFELKHFAPEEYNRFMKHRASVKGDEAEDIVEGCLVTLESIEQIKEHRELNEYDEYRFRNTECCEAMIDLLTADSYRVERVDEDGNVRLKSLNGMYPREIITGVL